MNSIYRTWFARIGLRLWSRSWEGRVRKRLLSSRLRSIKLDSDEQVSDSYMNCGVIFFNRDSPKSVHASGWNTLVWMNQWHDTLRSHLMPGFGIGNRTWCNRMKMWIEMGWEWLRRAQKRKTTTFNYCKSKQPRFYPQRLESLHSLFGGGAWTLYVCMFFCSLLLLMLYVPECWCAIKSKHMVLYLTRGYMSLSLCSMFSLLPDSRPPQ